MSLIVNNRDTFSLKKEAKSTIIFGFYGYVAFCSLEAVEGYLLVRAFHFFCLMGLKGWQTLTVCALGPLNKTSVVLKSIRTFIVAEFDVQHYFINETKTIK